MPRVEVGAEREAVRGWEYDVTIRHDNGASTAHTVRLSWADHDYWSGGRLAPSKVVEAVLDYIFQHGGGAALPLVFDAARARRLLPRIDEELRIGA